MLESRSEPDLNERSAQDADAGTRSAEGSSGEASVAPTVAVQSSDNQSEPPTGNITDEVSARPDSGDRASVDRLPPQMDLVNVRGGLRAVVEAVLMASETPMDEDEIATSLGVTSSQVLDVIVDLGSDLATGDRGVEVFRVGSRWQIGPRGDLVDVAARVVRGECATSLSRAAVETLAVIAYRQPITRRELADIRGLDVTTAVRSLVARGLIAESSIKPGTEETQLSTTADFLEYVQLDSLEDLPPI